MKFILASKSPRRREILSDLGLQFDIVTADTDESCDITNPKLLVQELALRKGRAVADSLDCDTIIIASDTVVACNGEILGKPCDRDDAKRMLDMLSGTKHQVISGIALISKEKEVVSSEVTQVIFDVMSDSDKEIYLNSNEPYDKAGAYAIQGLASMWIKGIEGDYFNVVGLPVKLLHDLLLKEFGIDMATLVKE
ncbi:MAG: septum formation protein Maf [Clostridia bacterium]|nr:septum formation protein Maf [Clostridia bacterium]